MDEDTDIVRLERELAERREFLDDLKRKLPAHSIRPHQLIEIEETEEQIDELLAELSRRAPQG